MLDPTIAGSYCKVAAEWKVTIFFFGVTDKKKQSYWDEIKAFLLVWQNRSKLKKKKKALDWKASFSHQFHMSLALRSSVKTRTH